MCPFNEVKFNQRQIADAFSLTMYDRILHERKNVGRENRVKCQKRKTEHSKCDVGRDENLERKSKECQVDIASNIKMNVYTQECEIKILKDIRYYLYNYTFIICRLR